MPIILETVRRLLDIILSLVPVEVARAELDQAAVERANRIADLAEAEKFRTP